MLTLNWRNTDKDDLPDHGEEILISINGVNYLAKYNSKEKIFEDVNSDSCFWVGGDQPIYWCKIRNPESYLKQTGSS